MTADTDELRLGELRIFVADDVGHVVTHPARFLQRKGEADGDGAVELDLFAVTQRYRAEADGVVNGAGPAGGIRISRQRDAASFGEGCEAGRWACRPWRFGCRFRGDSGWDGRQQFGRPTGRQR